MVKTCVSSFTRVLVCFLDIVLNDVHHTLKIFESYPLFDVKFVLYLCLSGSSIIEHEEGIVAKAWGDAWVYGHRP